MKHIFKYFPLFSLGFLTLSCEPKMEEVTPNRGDLDFSHYVAFGDYITAGYTKGAITRESQENAYPAILAWQFAKAGGKATFEQPYINSIGNQPKLSFTGFNAEGLAEITGVDDMYKFILTGCAANAYDLYEHYNGAAPENLQNLGIPGLRIRQVGLAGLGDQANNTIPVGSNPPKFNPYFERIMQAGDTRSYLEIAGKSNPTFFSCWVGMADILAYAFSGGTCNSMPTQLTTGTNPNTKQFSINFFNLLDSISDNGIRKGVVCTLPTLKDLPIYNGSNPLKYQQKLRDLRNDQTLTIYTERISNLFLPPGGTNLTIVPIGHEDVILKSGYEKIKIGRGLSASDPLSNADVLNDNEILNIEDNIGKYNNVIKSVGTTAKYKDRIAVVNTDALFSAGEIRNGVIYNGVIYNSSALTGGVFSLDNFTLTPRGQAIVANKIIFQINEFFNTKIPEVDVNSYPIL